MNRESSPENYSSDQVDNLESTEHWLQLHRQCFTVHIPCLDSDRQLWGAV